MPLWNRDRDARLVIAFLEDSRAGDFRHQTENRLPAQSHRIREPGPDVLQHHGDLVVVDQGGLG